MTVRFRAFGLLSFLLAFGPALSAQQRTANDTLARPSWATPERFRGRLEPTTPVTIQVHLPLRDLEGAKAELEAVSDPASPRYGQYLSSEDFESKYSPAVEDLATVQSYLQSEGFKISYSPRNRLFVSATATVADVERVFSTHLGQYEVESGQLRRAPIEAAKLPATLASRVSTVLGLHVNVVKPLALTSGRLSAAAKTPPTCSDYFGEYFDTADPPYGGGYPSPAPLNPCGLTPPRLRQAYGLADAVESGNDGRGVRIAIVDAWIDPTIVSDAQAYAAQFDPAHPLLASQISLVAAPSGGDPSVPVDFSWYYEQVFDVEAVHAVAPGANIVFVGAATSGTEDLLAALNLVVQDNLATIVSNSWTTDIELANDSGHAVLDPILIQGGLKGIGMFFGSGDTGDNQCGIINNFCPTDAGGAGAPAVFYPASSPYATAVGGTSLFLNKDGSRAYETGWETGESALVGHGSKVQWSPSPPGLLVFGAGGGPSRLYAQPKYQQGIVPSTLAGSPPARVVPDVAMLADFDSGIKFALTDPYSLTYTVFENGGGTSLAVQIFAATVGLAEQRAGHRIGFANPQFYRLAKSAFSDITPTKSPQSIVYPGPYEDTEDPPALMVQRPDGTIAPHTLHSAPGFDNVTGLGVPKGEAFLQAVAGNN